jgi:hypothetical protein
VRVGRSQGAASLLQVVALPARREEPAGAHHLEALVGDMAEEPAQEGEHGECLEGGLAALGIVAVGEADGATIVVGDAILGQDRALGIAADITQTGGGILEPPATPSRLP